MLFVSLCLCLLLTSAAFMRAAPLEEEGQGGVDEEGGRGAERGVEGGGRGGGEGRESILSKPTSVTTRQEGGGGGEEREKEEEEEEEEEDYYEYYTLEEGTKLYRMILIDTHVTCLFHLRILMYMFMTLHMTAHMG